MINENGVYVEQTFEELKQIVTDYATQEGLDPAGLVENILINFNARILEENEEELYKSYQKQFFPAGSDLDLQNPGFPRKTEEYAAGILTVTNNTGGLLSIGFNTIFTIFGREYSTKSNSVDIADTEDGQINIESVEKGLNQNVVAGQTTWTSSIVDIDTINNYPIDGGLDNETGTNYYNRLVLGKTGSVSVYNSLQVENELRKSYQDAKLFVNNQNNTSSDPIVIAPNGYLAVVRYIGGAEASDDDIKDASEILANRYELINNIATQASPPHYLKSYTVFIRNTPIIIYTLAAVPVETTITATINVTFLSSMVAAEKSLEAVNFGRRYAQRISQFLSGVEGDAIVNFTPDGEPIENYTTPIAPLVGVDNRIAPVINIEQFRALILDSEDITSNRRIFYNSCPALTVVLDPLESGESNISLNIAGPRYSANFAEDALFTDDSSWFDRFITIDPALITINIVEV